MYNEETNDVRGIGANLSVPSAKQPEAVRASEKLHKLCEALTQNVNMLENRLSPVMRKELEGSNDKVAVPEFSTVLAQDINMACSKIDTQITRIARIQALLEV